MSAKLGVGALDVTGERYGRLIALRFAERKGTQNHRCWLFRCDCGREVIRPLGDVRKGRTRSCGCLTKERITRHGGAYSLEYGSWGAMKHRCLNPRAPHYADYGGRGITVCDRWLHSFANFREDMGPRPSAKHSIDRIDNDGPYTPDNCKWSTRSEQNRNKRAQALVPLPPRARDSLTGRFLPD